ncbi:MAG: hypothetical protein BWK80_60240 [Desulfobacteraceae bacterium IS3]|nr:MAG: hypothetical protein BWK80_60240 [Desulfobacteraceae bacterium IS3]
MLKFHFSTPEELKKAIIMKKSFIAAAFLFIFVSPLFAENSADELIKLYGVLSEDDHPLVSTAKKIFEQVTAAADKRGNRYPNLIILRRTEGSLASALEDGTVILTQKGMELCFKGTDTETGSARIAFIFGHELAHLAKDDDWHKTAIDVVKDYLPDPKLKNDTLELLRRADDTGNGYMDADIRRKKELQADAYGMLYACMTGYDYRAVADEKGKNFFAELLKHSGDYGNEVHAVSGQSPYPLPEERAEFLLSYIRSIRNDLDLFYIGTRLYQLGMYDEALKYLKAFRERFPSREVFNNIGLIYYRNALKYLAICDPSKVCHFQCSLATRLDNGTRAMIFAPRADSNCPEKKHFEENLKEAIQYFNSACEKDPNYAPARINLSSVYIMQGRYSGATDASDQLLKFSPDDPAALNNKAIAMYLLGPSIKVDMFAQAEDILRSLIKKQPDFSCALYNLGYMQSERGRNDSAKETWNTYLKTCPDNICSDFIRKTLGIESAGKPDAPNPRGFPEPPPVKLGEIGKETLTYLKKLEKHKPGPSLGEFYSGNGIRVLAPEGIIEVVECPVTGQISDSDIIPRFGQPIRILNDFKGLKTYIYDKFALDVRGDTVTKLIYF